MSSDGKESTRAVPVLWYHSVLVRWWDWIEEEAIHRHPQIFTKEEHLAHLRFSYARLLFGADRLRRAEGKAVTLQGAEAGARLKLGFGFTLRPRDSLSRGPAQD